LGGYHNSKAEAVEIEEKTALREPGFSDSQDVVVEKQQISIRSGCWWLTSIILATQEAEISS
jgi:hypothetical protein